MLHYQVKLTLLLLEGILLNISNAGLCKTVFNLFNGWQNQLLSDSMRFSGFCYE
nr:unnamed protein product [Callosobruchus chinensis]